jgi:hypothetical protein
LFYGVPTGTGEDFFHNQIKAIGMVVLDTDGQLQETIEVVMQADDSVWGKRCVKEFWSKPEMQVILQSWKDTGREVPIEDGLWTIFRFMQQMYRKYDGIELASDNVGYDIALISASFGRFLGMPESHYMIQKDLDLPETYDTAFVAELSSKIRDGRIACTYETSVFDTSDYLKGLIRGAGLDPKTRLPEILREMGFVITAVHSHEPLQDAIHIAVEFVIKCAWVESKSGSKTV